MPDHLKGLVVIVFLAIVAFAAARAPATAVAMAPADFTRRRNLWFAIVLIAFLAHNFWIYVLAAGMLLYAAQKSEPNRMAMYFFLLLALPAVAKPIPGMGVANFLFDIDYIRLLALAVLLPAYLALRKQPGSEPFGRLAADKVLIGYLVLGLALALYYSTLTAALRKGVFYAFIDVFLPYYVASRGLRTLARQRDALMAFVVAVLVMSPVLVFEFAKQWLLYSSLDEALGGLWGWGGYLMRGSNLRASGSAGHPIAAGYAVALALVFMIFLRRSVPSATAWKLGMLLLAAGLVAPLSRGPWVGVAAMALVLVLTGPAPAARLAKLALLGLVALPALLASPAGPVIIDHLPWVGSIEARNVEGRERMFATAFRLVWENYPFFGSTDFLETAEMEALRGPDGLIDLISTYVVIALTRGFVGLSLFLGFFAAIMVAVYKGMRRVGDKNDERYALGQALLAALAGILVIIGTVAPVVIVPPIFWSLAGVSLGYACMLAGEPAIQAARRAEDGRPRRQLAPSAPG